jgi:SagB-type dehydrogenase family enzyme
MLAAAIGFSEREGRRHVPSAGALYPLELYVLAARVRELPDGVHHFDPYANRLERLRSLPPELGSCLVDSSLADRAAALVVVTGVFWRTRVKYGPRGYRFVLLEAGHAVQNALLVASALGIAALPVGGYYDARVESLLGIDGVDESALYVLALGRP